MKYGELSDKILEQIYNEPDLRISENQIISTFSIEREKLALVLQYFKKCEYIEISGNIPCFMSGDFSEQYRNEHPDIISLTLKGIEYCEDKNTPPTIKPDKEVNIFSKNDFLSKNTVERNSISESESILGRVISFLKEIFIK